MDFEITPDLQQLVDSVRAVLAEECPTALARDVVENGRAPEQPWKSARELGWASIDLPESLGGLELGFTALGLVVEQHGQCIAPGPFLATVSQTWSSTLTRIMSSIFMGGPFSAWAGPGRAAR